jgi:hypothetical protein
MLIFNLLSGVKDQAEVNEWETGNQISWEKVFYILDRGYPRFWNDLVQGMLV